MESLHEAGLAVGIGLGDVLHVRADEDQAAGAGYSEFGDGSVYWFNVDL